MTRYTNPLSETPRIITYTNHSVKFQKTREKKHAFQFSTEGDRKIGIEIRERERERERSAHERGSFRVRADAKSLTAERERPRSCPGKDEVASAT